MKGMKLLLIFVVLMLRIETLFCICSFQTQEVNLSEFIAYDKIVMAKVVSVLDSATLSPYSTFLTLQIDENFKGKENSELSIFSFNYSINPVKNNVYLFYIEVDEDGNDFIGMCTRTKEWANLSSSDKLKLKEERFKNEVNNLREFKKIEEEELEGEFLFKYSSGIIMVIFNQKNGKLNGAFELRNEQGQTISKGKYINDLKEGCWEEIYSNLGESIIIERGNYFKGKKIGRWPRYIQSKGGGERYLGIQIMNIMINNPL